MTEYQITLPKADIGKVPNIEASKLNKDLELALSVFDTDGVKGLNEKELLEAFNYFVNKEKEVAISGNKCDRIITSKDIEEIIKTDDKFSHLKEKINDNKVVDILAKAILFLSGMIELQNELNNDEITVRFAGLKNINYRNEKDRTITDFPYRKMVEYVQSEFVEIDGQNIQICKNNKDETFVKTANGEICTDPKFVAKCLGYEVETHWFTSDEYYTMGYISGNVQKENHSNRVADECKQYKIWNKENNSFTDGKIIATGLRRVFIGTK